MTQQYAKDQLSGFSNRIERVAIIGVSWNNFKTLLFDIDRNRPVVK